MDSSFDIIFIAVAFVCGILLLTGNGGILMKGGNQDERNRMYDQKKMEKASGIALVAIGVATTIDHFLTGVVFKFAYTLVVLAIFVGLIIYIRKKCRKQ